MKIKDLLEALSSYKEIEFVCYNSEFTNSTTKQNQTNLFNDLKSVPGVFAYRQNFSDSKHEQISLAVIFKSNANTENSIKALAQKNNVAIDIIDAINDKVIDNIISGRRENILDWFNSDYLNEDIEELKLPTLHKGDKLLVGRFKNKKVTIKSFEKDKLGQPVAITDRGKEKIFKPRIPKLFNEAELTEGRDAPLYHNN